MKYFIKAIPKGFSSTMYKNNSSFCSNIKACSPILLYCSLAGMKLAIGCYSYTPVIGNPHAVEKRLSFSANIKKFGSKI